MKQPLLIVGASARAAAAAACRAGFQPLAADLFGDQDLRSLGPTVRVEHYPQGLPSAVSSFPDCPWMYTGALENSPAVIERLAAQRPLWGNAAAQLRRVRDPFCLASVLKAHGFAALPLRPANAPPRRGRWLRKPLRSAGGFGIAPQVVGDHASRSAGVYFQQFAPGPSYSAVYLAAGGAARLLGVTRQLIGRADFGGTGFRYCGSLTRARSPVNRCELQRLGACLAQEFELQGLFGVDFVVCRRQMWPLEVNPRYTASCELLEQHLQLPLIAWHAAACCHKQLPEQTDIASRGRTTRGKAIVFSDRDVIVLPRLAELVAKCNGRSRWPQIADVPAVNERIRCGLPIVTIFAGGADAAQVLSRLARMAHEVRRCCH